MIRWWKRLRRQRRAQHDRRAIGRATPTGGALYAPATAYQGHAGAYLVPPSPPPGKHRNELPYRPLMTRLAERRANPRPW